MAQVNSHPGLPGNWPSNVPTVSSMQSDAGRTLAIQAQLPTVSSNVNRPGFVPSTDTKKTSQGT